MTPLQRLQVFHIYNNAKVILADGNTIDSVYFITACALEHYDVNKGKLILRGIDQLTEEEIFELLKIDPWSDYREGMDKEPYLEYVKTMLANENLYFGISDYLRSKNIALPYMGIDLFESGIAVREN